jgi:hypothetical protein
MVQPEDLRFGRKTARLSNRMNSILSTVKDCIEERRLFPALTLIYSSIDILGSLQNANGFASRDSFKNWIRDYLFQAKALPCSESDLWGARCGIVHTLRYDSQYPESGQKEIVYGFFGYDLDIQNIQDTSKQVGVYVEDLFEALKIAYEKYLEDLENSANSIQDANINKLPQYIDLIPWG